MKLVCLIVAAILAVQINGLPDSQADPGARVYDIGLELTVVGDVQDGTPVVMQGPLYLFQVISQSDSETEGAQWNEDCDTGAPGAAPPEVTSATDLSTA